MRFLPVSEPSVGSLEEKYVSKAVASTWISSLGEYVDKFETHVSDLTAKKFSLAVSNGTTALDLTLKALGITDGDEVVVTAWTFVAPINAILYQRATPVFVDVELESGLPTPDMILDCVTERTKAVIIVHGYGEVFPTPELRVRLPEHITIIEDCAEAHGARYANGAPVGSAGTVATYSYYGNKIITTGEGGSVSSDNEELIHLMRELRDHAMSPNKRYWHNQMGYNYRLTNVQAALGCAQFSQFSSFLAKRDEVKNSYIQGLSSLSRIRFLSSTDGSRPVNWLTTIFVDGYSRGDVEVLSKALGEKGIQTRPVFYPATNFDYVNASSRKDSHLPNSKILSDTGISLPTSVVILPSEVSYVCNSIVDLLK